MQTVSQDFGDWVSTNPFGLDVWVPNNPNHQFMLQFIHGILLDFDFKNFQRWIHDLLTPHSMCPFFTPQCLNKIVEKLTYIIKQFENIDDEDNLYILTQHLIFLVDNIIY